MNTWLNYFVEANIGLLLFLLLYKILLNKETHFSYRRFYLLGGLILSLVFPWLTLSSSVEVVPTLSETLPTYWLPQSTEQLQSATEPALTFWEIATMLYASVAMLLIIRFTYNVISLVRHAGKAKDGNPVIEVDQSSFIAFSFFKLIFISKAFNLSEADKQHILLHEQVHISKWHSADMVLMELVRILFWFNPLLTYYKKELSTVHEFEADEIASAYESPDQYCNLLARSAIESSGFALANHFNNSLTLKRITMIRALKQKVKQWKTLIVFLFVSILFLSIACQDQIVAEMEELSQTTTIAGEFPDHLKPIAEKIRKENPGIKLMYIEAESINEEKIKRLNPNSIMHTGHIKNKDNNGNVVSERVELIVRSDDSVSQLGDMTKSEDEVYLVVEEVASPVIGMTEFYDVLNQEIKIPTVAIEKEITGKVFVEMIIEPDGTTSNYRVLKGIGSGCDEEALRALSSINVLWNPGKQRGEAVRQKFVIPIVFDKNKAVRPEFADPSSQIINIINFTSKTENGKKVISGFVRGQDDKPLNNVNIVVTGKTYGTNTKEDGSFTLVLQEASAQVVFSHIGYISKAVKIE